MAGGSAPERRWALRPGFPILTRDWGRETVVYHGGSGDTHLVGPSGRALLDVLGEGARGERELEQRLADTFDAGPAADRRHELHRLLTDFETLGLVAPVDES